ncbi:restriction endonuclease subunit S [Streptomyces azureus]|uniref:Restriction endonuclease S subunits-like protein n=1 Tax=Streptomyces azureus TaxID=146537 RepID=A0A0K8PXJ7_STRAJ|nr:restriction endonuclease subunit S [Streptomyces azureus]GAP52184.1 restriction endonuclease S subunits-like protein [Streptomyces azureus]
MIENLNFPEAWSTCLVSEAGEAIAGQQRTPAAANGPDVRPYLRVANVFDDRLDLEDLATMSFSPEARLRYKLQAGDVLLCEGQSRELVGRSALYNGEVEELYFQNHIIRFRPREEINPNFALLVFRAYQHSGVFSALARGTTNIVNLGLKRFRNLPFPVPPFEVQREIVERAREGQDLVDLTTDALQKAMPIVSDLPRKVRDRIILGDTHVDLESPSELAGGEWRKASEVVDAHAPIVYGIHQPGPDIDDEHGVPYIRGQDLREGEILEDQLRRTSPEIARKYERSALRPGDVLLGIIRHTRVAIVPQELDGAHITQGTARLRPGAEIDSSFLAHWLASGTAQTWLRGRMRGINMPGLNLADVRQLPVPLFSAEKQRELVSLLDDAISELDLLREKVESGLKRSAAIERALISSFAYGSLAQEISSERTGARTSVDLVSSLRAQVRQAPRGNRKKEVAAKKRVSARTAKASPSRDRLIEALRAAGTRATPEELYASLALTEEDADEFYFLLRDLERNGLVQVHRPDDTAVFLEVSS